MSERNAITELVLETFNEYANSCDDDELLRFGLDAIDSERITVESWLDDYFENCDVTYAGMSGSRRPELLSVQIVDLALRDLDVSVIADHMVALAREVMERIDDGIAYLVDGSHGIYSGAILVDYWRDNLLADDEALDIVAAGPSDDSPEREHQAFLDIMDAGMFMDGYDYNLYSGDGIYAVRSDLAPLLPDGWPS